MSLRLKAFPCPPTSEGPDTLSPAGLQKGFDTQQSTQSRNEVCEMSGLELLCSTEERAGWRSIIAQNGVNTIEMLSRRAGTGAFRPATARDSKSKPME